MPTLSPSGTALLGLTMVVGLLAGVLAYAVFRIGGAARQARLALAASDPDRVLLTSALQDAVMRLRQQEQQSLARAEASEHLSALIVDHLRAGLLVARGDGTVLSLNPAARRLLGVADAPLPAPLDAVLGDVPELTTCIRGALAGGAAATRTTLALAHRAPGRPSHLGVTLSPLPAQAGQGPGVVCLFTDLSAVVALEEQLRLRDALARVGELTAGIAHEFRNGLATIHGYARLLDPDALGAPHAAYVQGIRDETTALGEVVTNFLRYARPERVTWQPLPLSAVVQRAVADVHAPEGAIHVEGAFGWVDGDEVLLRQTLANLLRNALEACETAGTTPDIRVVGEVRQAEREVQVRVADNGPGLPGDALARERLFQPFVTSRSRGTGLGLALVQKFVVLHHGRVEALDGPGGGAQFVLHLPLGGPMADGRPPGQPS